MFYQKQPQSSGYFRLRKDSWCKIDTHIHSFFELHCCTDKCLCLTIAGKEYILQAGEAALIFPYQAHSFPDKQGEGYFCTFEPALIASFADTFANRLPRKNVFSFFYPIESLSQTSDLYQIKSFLYAMCSQAAQLEYVELSEGNRVLLEKVFRITEESFADCDFSLEQLATRMGYDYSYISKYFLQKTGLRYKTFLNQRRIDHAAKLLRTDYNGPLSELAYACGYNSVRSFNRNFCMFKNCTPREYKGKKHKQGS